LAAKRSSKPFYVGDAPSDLALKDPYIDGMMKALHLHDLIPEIDVKTPLIIEEAITNAIRHGNKHDAKKRVHIELHLTKRGWAMLMADEGKGFDPGSVPDPRTPEGMMREGGRGLLIIKSFMDKVEFRNGGATIWCEKFSEAAAAPESKTRKKPAKTKAKKKTKKKTTSKPAKKRPAKAGKTKAKTKAKKKPTKKAPKKKATKKPAKKKPAKPKRRPRKGTKAKAKARGGGGK